MILKRHQCLHMYGMYGTAATANTIKKQQPYLVVKMVRVTWIEEHYFTTRVSIVSIRKTPLDQRSSSLSLSHNQSQTTACTPKLCKQCQKAPAKRFASCQPSYHSTLTHLLKQNHCSSSSFHLLLYFSVFSFFKQIAGTFCSTATA